MAKKGQKRYKGPLSKYRSHERRRIREEIYERDKYTCQICMTAVDISLTDGHPQAPTLDHIKAHRDGGSDKLDNLRLAHAECNNLRHNRLGQNIKIESSVNIA